MKYLNPNYEAIWRSFDKSFNHKFKMSNHFINSVSRTYVYMCNICLALKNVSSGCELVFIAFRMFAKLQEAYVDIIKAAYDLNPYKTTDKTISAIYLGK